MKTKQQYLVINFIILTIVFIAPCIVQSTNKGEESTNYAKNIIVFEAARDVLNYPFEDIKKSDLEFVSFDKTRVPYSFSKNNTWIRMKMTTDGLDMEKDKYIIVFEDANIDYIDAYIPIMDHGKSVYQGYHKGLMRSLNDREISNNKWNFFIPKNIDTQAYIYFLVKSNVDVDISVESYFSSTREANKNNLYFGLYFGFLLAVIIFGLYIYGSVGRKYYIYYVLYISSMFFYQMRIHCYLSYFINVSYSIYMRLLWFFVLFMFLFAMLFSVRFLDTKKYCRKIDRAIQVVFSIAVATSIIGVLGYYKLADTIMHPVQIACPFLIIIAAAIRLKQGFKPAGFFMTGWIMVTLSSAVWSFAVHLPATVPTQYILQIGFIGEVMFIALALAKEVKQVLVDREKLKYLSSKDSLTNFYNKRYMINKIQKLINEDTVSLFSIVMIDIDDFKNINDQFGHIEGDKILIQLTELIQVYLRHIDIPCRYGGDEMLVILPQTNKMKAYQIAEQIRKKVNKVYVDSNSKNIPMSVSIGITEYVNGDTYEGLIKKGDKALYRAKELGKNKTVIE